MKHLSLDHLTRQFGIGAAKLKKQLLDRKQELDEKIYEQNVALKKATKNREEVGVQLYDL